LVREQIGLIHAVLYTHAHADHLFGLDDLRIFARYLGRDLPVYCEEEVEQAVRGAFAYDGLQVPLGNDGKLQMG